MNKIVANGTQDFMGKVIPVIEGGFGEDCRVISVKTVAEIHEMEIKHVNELINKNRQRFKDNIDIIDLYSNENLKVVATDLGLKGSNRTKNVYLLSERGYGKLIKIMDTDLAWDIYDKLLDEYFTMRKVIKQISERDQHILNIHHANSSLELAMAVKGFEEVVEKETTEKVTKQITEEVVVPLQEENKQQQETIQQQAPKVSYYDIILQSNNLVTSTDIAKDYGWSAVKLNKYLNEKKVIYDANRNSKSKSKKWTPYAEYQKDGIMQTFTNVDTKGESHITYKWTQTGRKFIYELLKKEEGILPLCERESEDGVNE